MLEALIGAVALQDAGLDSALKGFAHVVLPPPDVLAALAEGEMAQVPKMRVD